MVQFLSYFFSWISSIFVGLVRSRTKATEFFFQKFPFLCHFVYAPSGAAKQAEREAFFNTELIYILRNAPENLPLCGDFNCVSDSSDATGTCTYVQQNSSCPCTRLRTARCLDTTYRQPNLYPLLSDCSNAYRSILRHVNPLSKESSRDSSSALY